MKQNITVNQIEELNDKGCSKYKKLKDFYNWFDSEMIWLNDKVYLLTVGQMIQILKESSSGMALRIALLDDDYGDIVHFKNKNYENLEICDSLWMAVKKLLVV